MYRHVGRVVRYGWLPTVAFGTALVSDMNSAVQNADKNIEHILRSSGATDPPQHLATYIWSHPLPMIALLIGLFIIGALLSWAIEWAWGRIVDRKPLIAQTSKAGSDNTFIGRVPRGLVAGSRNTVVDDADDRGNTILNNGGVAIGAGATDDPTSVAIGSGASVRRLRPASIVIENSDGEVNISNNHQRGAPKGWGFVYISDHKGTANLEGNTDERAGKDK